MVDSGPMPPMMPAIFVFILSLPILHPPAKASDNIKPFSNQGSKSNPLRINPQVPLGGKSFHIGKFSFPSNVARKSAMSLFFHRLYRSLQEDASLYLWNPSC